LVLNATSAELPDYGIKWIVYNVDLSLNYPLHFLDDILHLTSLASTLILSLILDCYISLNLNFEYRTIWLGDCTR